MSEQDLRKSAGSALLWLGGASILKDIVQFGATILLTRLLNPETYGQAALAQTILGFFAVFSFRSFVTFGLQHRNPLQFDWKRHLRIGFTVNLLIYLIINLASLLLWGIWGSRYQSVSIVLSCLSLSLLIEPFASLHTTWLQANHQWQRLRMIEISAALASAVGGVLLAFCGAGVLALAAMTPLSQLPALSGFLMSRRHVTAAVSSDTDYLGAKEFGLNRMSSGVVLAGVGVVEQTLMTSIFGFASLGFYNRALGLVNITSGRIGPLVIATLYPVLTRAGAGSDRFRRFSGTLIRSLIAVLIPAASFVACESQSLVYVLFGSKWIASAAFVPLVALYITANSMNFMIYQVMLANGQQQACLKIDIFTGMTRLAVVIFLLPLGVSVFIIGLCLQGTIILLISIESARRGRAIEGWRAFRSIFTITLAAGSAVVAAALTSNLGGKMHISLLWLMLTVIVFSVTYLGSLRILAIETLVDLIDGMPLSPNGRARVKRFAYINKLP